MVEKELRVNDNCRSLTGREYDDVDHHRIFLFSLRHHFIFFFFFFQAEDGIRDLYVTGVQTCALPISLPSRSTTVRWFVDVSSGPAVTAAEAVAHGEKGGTGSPGETGVGSAVAPIRRSEERRVGKECRSRGAPYH